MRFEKHRHGYAFLSALFNQRGENVKYVVVPLRKNLIRIINIKQIIQTCRHPGSCAFAKIVIYIVIASYIGWMWLRGILKNLSGNN